MPKIQESNGRLHITLPLRYCEHLGWTRGTNVEVFLVRNSLVLSEKIYDRIRGGLNE